MNRLKLWSFIVLLMLLLISCEGNKQSDTFFKQLSSEFNLLEMKRTSYSYNGLSIYAIGNPKRGLYDGFGISYVLLVKDGVINMISIDKNCYEQYRSKYYQIQEWKETKRDNLDPCKMIVYQFVDLNQSVGDTMFLFTQTRVRSSFWSTLTGKYFSAEIGDTIYEYRRQLGDANKIQQIYNITKEVGIVGMANLKGGVITDSVGYPFIKETRCIPLDTINVDILKYIKNIRKLTPSQ